MEGLILTLMNVCMAAFFSNSNIVSKLKEEQKYALVYYAREKCKSEVAEQIENMKGYEQFDRVIQPDHEVKND